MSTLINYGNLNYLIRKYSGTYILITPLINNHIKTIDNINKLLDEVIKDANPESGKEEIIFSPSLRHSKDFGSINVEDLNSMSTSLSPDLTIYDITIIAGLSLVFIGIIYYSLTGSIPGLSYFKYISKISSLSCECNIEYSVITGDIPNFP
jgi:hypothetical protein